MAESAPGLGISEFIVDRITTPFKHVSGIVDSVVTAVAKTFGTKRSVTNPGILGVLRETGKSILNTINGSERSIFTGNSWNPLDPKGLLNPADRLRRLVTGITETVSNAAGLVYWVGGDTTKNIIRNTLYGVTSVITGDTKDYRKKAIEDKEPMGEVYGPDLKLLSQK